MCSERAWVLSNAGYSILSAINLEIVLKKKKKKSNSKDLFHIFNHYINMQLLLDPNIAPIFNVFTTVTQNSYFKHGVLQPIDLKLCLASS